MPTTNTGKIWIKMDSLVTSVLGEGVPNLHFFDDGAAPYWSGKEHGLRSFIPSSPANAMKEGLLILWATYLDNVGNIDSDLFDVFGNGVTPVRMGDLEITEDIYRKASDLLNKFNVFGEFDADTYVDLSRGNFEQFRITLI